MLSPRFIHLHLHSEYSLIDGLIAIKPLIKSIKAMNMPAVAITDHCNLFAMVKFYRAAIAAGIKPIIGSELLIHENENKNKICKLVLLCQNDIGYRNLTRLISRAYLEGQSQGKPLINKVWLEGATAGLIALSGGTEGDIGLALIAKQKAVAEKLLQDWETLFPNRFYMELQRTGRENEDIYTSQALQLAKDKDIPVIATNNVRFLTKEDFEAHEARVCIHQGCTLEDHRRPKIYSEQQYLRSEAEMISLFQDIPEALQNSVEIAKRCSLSLTLDQNFLPNFPVPEDISVDEFFKRESENGLEKRLTFLLNRQASDFEEKRRPYDERLQREISVIQKMGFPGYFFNCRRFYTLGQTA